MERSPPAGRSPERMGPDAHLDLGHGGEVGSVTARQAGWPPPPPVQHTEMFRNVPSAGRGGMCQGVNGTVCQRNSTRSKRQSQFSLLVGFELWRNWTGSIHVLPPGLPWRISNCWEQRPQNETLQKGALGPGCFLCWATGLWCSTHLGPAHTNANVFPGVLGVLWWWKLVPSAGGWGDALLFGACHNKGPTLRFGAGLGRTETVGMSNQKFQPSATRKHWK